MQSKTSLDRAKAWIKSHARAGALVVMPLAAVASAHASVILPTSNFTCSATGDSACSGGASPFSNTGVSFWLSSGGYSFAGAGSITMTTSGPVASPIGAGVSIPYSFNIMIFVGSTPETDWSVEYEILDVTSETTVFEQTLTGTTGSFKTTISGSGNLSTVAGTSAGDQLVVGVVFSESASNQFTDIWIPEGTSIDLGPTGSATISEPATMGLLGGGLAWLGFQRRKRGKGPK